MILMTQMHCLEICEACYSQLSFIALYKEILLFVIYVLLHALFQGLKKYNFLV